MTATQAPAPPSEPVVLRSLARQTDLVHLGSGRFVLAVLRLAMGFIFLWAFLDKTFGLGYSTPPERA